MPVADLLFYSEPYIWSGIGGLVVLLCGLLPGGRRYAFIVTVIALAGVLFSSLYLAQLHPSETIDNFIDIEVYTQSFIVLCALTALAVVFITRRSLAVQNTIDEVYYALILFSVLGMSIIPSDNLIALLTGIELVTVSAFCLIAWHPGRPGATEAAIKFVITAGLATALLLLAIGCIYSGAGTVLISDIQNRLLLEQSSTVMVVTGLVLLMAGVAFELAAVPFHNWLADVYEGAPAPVAALLGSVAKVAVLVWLMMLPYWLNTPLWIVVRPVVLVLAVLSMVAGTLLALRQKSLRRMLAYSSVVHMGFMLAAMAVYSPAVMPVIIYYALGYVVSTVAAFALISVFEKGPGLRQDFRGAGRHQPPAGLAFVVVMLSLAGIPPLTGFFGKLMILQVLLNHHSYVLALVMVLCSAAGVFYYIRASLVVFDPAPAVAATADHFAVAQVSRFNINLVTITLCTVLVVLLGVCAQPVFELAVAMLP